MISGTIHAAYINYGQCCVCRCLVQRLHPAMGIHGIVHELVGWASPTKWRIICGTIHAAYINYGQCCVCRCLVQRLHPAMGRHGIVLVLVSWTPLSTWHFTCVIIHATCMNYGQYYACRCLVQRLHPAMGRHSIVLRTCKLNSTIYMAFDLCYHPCRMHELWSIPCLPMSGAETASSHGQTRHSTSYL